MVLPDGTERVYGPGVKATDLPEKDDEWWGRPRPECTLRVINMDFAWKLITRHDTGLGEAWMDGDIGEDTQMDWTARDSSQRPYPPLLSLSPIARQSGSARACVCSRVRGPRAQRADAWCF